MAKKLSDFITNNYCQSCSKLQNKTIIFFHTESKGDIPFWYALLKPLETEKINFKAISSSQNSLTKGKQIALNSNLGPHMIACVDADYDYLLPETNELSKKIRNSPYIFHTYAYAIENFQCYANTLDQVNTSISLDTENAFPFKFFLEDFSRIIFPLFIWQIWCYQHNEQRHFDLNHFAKTIYFGRINIYKPQTYLEVLTKKVHQKIGELQKLFPQAKESYKKTKEHLRSLGVLPSQTYLFIRGHDLKDKLIIHLLTDITDLQKQKYIKKICNLAKHETQQRNELLAYEHEIQPVEVALKTHTFYRNCYLYERIQNDLTNFLQQIAKTNHNYV